MSTEPNASNTSNPSEGDNKKPIEMDGLLGIGGMLGGFTQFLNQLGNLAEKGEQLKRAAQSDATNPGSKVAGTFGYTVKFGGESLGGAVSNEAYSSESHVTPRAPNTVNRTNDSKTSRPVQSVREPVVDTFDEGSHYLIVAEMPGISRENVSLKLDETTAQLLGSNSFMRYEKTIEIPNNLDRNQINIVTNNGIVEIRISTL